MLPQHKTKEGVLNEKLALKKLLTYITSVYKIPQKIKCLSDQRHDKRMNDCLPPILFSAIFKLLKVLPDTELDAC